MAFGLEKLEVGVRYNVSSTGHWYKEIVEILDMKENKALAKAVSDDGATFYTHFIRNEKSKEWEPFITGICKDGLLY